MICPGTQESTPAKIIIELPFPIHDSLITSPSHIRNNVPAVIKSMAGRTAHQKLDTSIIFPPPPMRVFNKMIIP